MPGSPDTVKVAVGWECNYVSELVLPFNPLNTKLNPICPLLALLGAHRILHVSRIRAGVHAPTKSVSVPVSISLLPPVQPRSGVDTYRQNRYRD